MKTEVISVNSRGEGTELALEETSGLASAIGLDKKSALRLRLLAEEMIGMIQAITGVFSAQYWVEQTREGLCRLHLDAETSMDLQKKEDLLDVATDHRNAAAKGFMSKIWNLIEDRIYQVNEAGQIQQESGNSPMMFGVLGACDVEAASAMTSYAYLWTLSQYRDSVGARLDEDPTLQDALDELEKSIVASIADEVRVGIRGNHIELVIEKMF